MSDESSRIIASHDYGPKRFKWLTLKLIEWQDPSGKTRFWESCERTTRAASGVDAVAIVVKAISTSSPPKIVLVSQYRPPLASICLELPAGLIDKGESAEDAAFRELHEETGLTPHRLISVSPACCSDPGMTNTNMQLAVVEVDLDAPVNRNIKQNLDDGECIDVEMAPWEGLRSWLVKRKIELGCQIDARLMSFAIGLDLGLNTTTSDKVNAKDGSSNSGGNGGGSSGGGGTSKSSFQSLSRATTGSTSTSSTAGATTGSTSNNASSSIALLTEKNIAMKDSPTSSFTYKTNNKITQHHAGNTRSDSVQTDVLQAMSSLQIQAAAKAYAKTLEEFHAERQNKESNEVSSSIAKQQASSAGVEPARGVPEMAMGVAARTAQGFSATRASSSVISDGEVGED